MKKTLLLLFAFVSMHLVAKSQATVLQTGDVLITGWNMQLVNTNREVQFVSFVDLGPGTVIKFVNGKFQTGGSATAANNAARGGGISKWTNTTGTTIAKGTVITLFNGSTPTASIGSHTYVATACGCGGSSGTQGLSQSTSGGVIFMYYGTTTDGTTTDYASSPSIGSTTAARDPITFMGTPLEIIGMQGRTDINNVHDFLTAGNTLTTNFVSFYPSELSTYHLFLSDIYNNNTNAIAGLYTGTRTGSIATIKAALVNPINWTSAPYSTGTVTLNNTNFTFGTTPSFTGSTSLTVCQNASATAINSNLTITDAATSATETWSIVTPPAHGSLSGFTTTAAANGSSVTPSGLTYTPTGGYSGSDQFIIQVNNGSATANQTVNVTVTALPSTPTISAGSSTTFCTGGSVTLTSSSASGNQWSLNGSPIGGATNQTYNATSSGTYTVQVTSGSCTSAASSGTTVTVNTIPATPSILAGGPTTFCQGGSVLLTSSSGSGNQWYRNGSPIGGVTTPSFSTGVAGTYTIVVTTSGCSSSPSAATTLTVTSLPATPTISTGGSTTFCTGGSVTLTSSSASGNQWFLNGGSISGATFTNYNTSVAGAYTVVVTTAGCSSSPSAATNLTVTTPSTWYLDADNDGYYISTTSSCTNPGAGYNLTASNSGDCDDNNNAIHAAQPYYVDADHDGYGTGGIVMLCSLTAPFGFSVNNTDCNDANAAINPGATEIANGIDDNCNGQTDEGVCVVQSSFTPTYAAGTLSANWTSYTTHNDSLCFQRVGYNFAVTKIAATTATGARTAGDNTPVVGYTYEVWIEGYCNTDNSLQKTAKTSMLIPGGPCDLSTVTINSISATVSCPSISATLNWTAAASNQYQIAYRKISPNATAFKYKNESNTTIDSITLVDGVGVYQFSIRARCTNGGSTFGPNSNLVTHSITENCFNTITDFDAHAQDLVNCKKIILDWTPPACNAIQGYQIRYKLDNMTYFAGTNIPNVHHYTFVAAATGANRKYRFYITPILCGNILGSNSNLDSASINYLAAQPNSCPLTVRLANTEEAGEIHEPILNEVAMNIQPNPSNGTTTVHLQQDGLIHQLDLMNMYGQLIKSYSIAENQSVVQIQETNLTAGQYLLLIKAADGQLLAKQIWMVTKE